MKNPSRRYLQGGSLLVLASALAVITYGQLHDSSLRATVIRLSGYVRAYGEPKPYEAYVFIPMEFDEQDHALSCEVATLKMVLAYRGKKVDERTLIRQVGTDQTPHTINGGREQWGDPSEAFVGDIDGKMMEDGYGVHWQPIERVAKRYRSAKGFTFWSAEWLADELMDGNPVIIWGCLGLCQKRVWYGPGSENRITVAMYEHTFIVNGFNGTPDHIQGFWLIDPIYGRKYMELDSFMRMWETLDRSGVVVY